jgi:hypothetical protein
MLKVLRVVSTVFLLLGLIGVAAAAGFQVMQWVRDRIWNVEILYFGLYSVAVSAAGLLALALLEIRDAIAQAAELGISTKPEATRRNVDVRTSYLDIRER